MSTVLLDATLFPIAPDGGEPIRLARAWATAIGSGAARKEVRAAIRSVPVRRLEYTAKFVSAAECGEFRALWYGTLGTTERLRYTVPVWPMASTPSAFSSSTEIATDTVGRGFAIGGRALLWNSETDSEVVDIDDVGDSSITTVDPIEGAFVPGYTLVVPLMNAWLDPPTIDQRLQRAEQVPLVFREELPVVAGIDPDVGQATTPIAASIGLFQIKGSSPYAGQRFSDWEALVLDDAGQRIPNAPITWTVTSLGFVTLDPPTRITFPHNRQQVHLEFISGAGPDFNILAETGSVSASINV